ncbi:MAG: nucleoside-diphosphate kinase [Thermoplasmata archaeon]
MEQTFVMVKPDGTNRRLIGNIISRLEMKGLKLVGIKIMWVSRDLAEKHYAEHKGKGFYDSLIDYITSSPVVAMVWEGKSAVKVVRNLVGKTDPVEASPGTIRGDYGLDVGKNIVHASDSLESAEREISLYFNKEDIISWDILDHSFF